MFYRLFVPKQAAGSNKVYFDLWNAPDSDLTLEVFSVAPVVSGAVAVTGTLSVDLFLTRTTAVGTGGVEATYGGSDPTAGTFSRLVGSPLMKKRVNARVGPAGGATAGEVLSWTSVFTEEANAASYFPADLCPSFGGSLPLTVLKGSGIRVVQGAVASVGNIGFNVVFKAR